MSSGVGLDLRLCYGRSTQTKTNQPSDTYNFPSPSLSLSLFPTHNHRHFSPFKILLHQSRKRKRIQKVKELNNKRLLRLCRGFLFNGPDLDGSFTLVLPFFASLFAFKSAKAEKKKVFPPISTSLISSFLTYNQPIKSCFFWLFYFVNILMYPRHSLRT